MVKSRFLLALEFRDNPLGQLLAELDTPLVKRVNVPDRSLCKNTVLVESDEFTESFRSESLGQNRVGWAIALEHPVGHEPVRRALRPNLVGRLAESERFGLSEDIRNEDIMMPTKRI